MAPICRLSFYNGFVLELFVVRLAQASEAAKQTVARAKTEAQKRGLGERMKARASAVWASIDEVSCWVIHSYTS